MPKFTIVEIIREEREIEADTAQDALDAWLNAGDEAMNVGSKEPYVQVDERWVEDEDGRDCRVESN